MWESKKQLKVDAENAEKRAVTHFQKIDKIERILKHADYTKEMYFVTLDKIKRVIFPNTTSRR